MTERNHFDDLLKNVGEAKANARRAVESVRDGEDEQAIDFFNACDEDLSAAKNALQSARGFVRENSGIQ